MGAAAAAAAAFDFVLRPKINYDACKSSCCLAKNTYTLARIHAHNVCKQWLIGWGICDVTRVNDRCLPVTSSTRAIDKATLVAAD